MGCDPVSSSLCEANMETESPPNLESLVALWPVASSLSNYLPVGDLITVARLNATIRAVLHGFTKPEEAPPLEYNSVRRELNIGQHGTAFWQQLKHRAPFECSARLHTKGPVPKPCRYCSKPICEACIVKSSFARGHENTFQNRCRYLCRNCWDNGNPSRSQRFPLIPSMDSTRKRKWYDPDGSTKDYCTCTLKSDGWLCLDCKDLQNWEAISYAETYCHGKDCGEILDDDKERRRICLWCDKALPRQIGGTSRYHWNQKIMEARARNAASRQADLEEYNRKRLKLMRMSRREMRGDEAVKDDPDADLPQFVRHLDTINYRSYMSERAAPTGDAVYDSKRGYWRYSREFLLKIRGRCGYVPVPQDLSDFRQIDGKGLKFARTNAEKSEGVYSFTGMVPSMDEERVMEWYHLKTVILELILVKKLDYEDAQLIMLEDYHFEASKRDYRKMIHLWSSEGKLRARLRKAQGEDNDGSGSVGAVEDEDEDDSIDTAGENEIMHEAKTEKLPQSSHHDKSSTSIAKTTLDYASTPNQSNNLDPPDSRLDHKLLQDRESMAQQPSAAPLSSPQPQQASTSVVIADAAPNTGEESPTLSTEGRDVNRSEEQNGDPPPYTPNGWEWP